MKKENFDGFEVRLRKVKDSLWEAYFPEFPQMSEVNSSEILAVSKLNLKWHRYKKNCRKNEEKIPIPASRKAFSGQINLRIEPNLHQNLAIESAKYAMSLNSLISKKLGDSIEKSIQANFIINEVARLPFDRFSIILCFSGQEGEKIGLKFLIHNLKDELRNYGGDVIVESDEELKKCFLESQLKQAAQSFIIEQPFINKSREGTYIFECVLISLESISHAVHGQGIDEAFPEDCSDFFICRMD